MRSLSFSNGELYVGLNQHGLVSDVNFPYVGQDQHSHGLTHKIGVWVDGHMSWLDDGSWLHKSHYLHGALVGHTTMTNEQIGILLEFEDFVDSEKNAFIRNIHIVNLRHDQRNIRIFTHQAFNISNDLNSDSSQLIPDQQCILHYSGRRAFIVGGVNDVGQSFNQHSIGLYGGGRDGTWKDAEDGSLSGSSSALGKTDSTIGFSLTIGGLSSRRVHYWLLASTSVRGVKSLQDEIQKQGIAKKIESTVVWWRKWLNPIYKISERLEPEYRHQFIQSMMMVGSRLDRRGAIISLDNLSSNFNFNIQSAGYSIWPLIRLGYKDEVLRFFTFCSHAMTDEGYIMPSYGADGAVATTDKPYVDDKTPPIQSSDTALVVFLFSQLVSLQKNFKGAKDYYSRTIVPMANFLTRFTDDSGLPRASYCISSPDEPQTTSYTSALTYAALLAAAEMADGFKDQDSAVRWRSAAEDMKQAVITHLCDGGVVARSLNDASPDIHSLFSAFMFGLVDFDGQIVENTLRRVEGFSPVDEQDLVRNLWLAQYYLESGAADRSHEIIVSASKAMDVSMGDVNQSTWAFAELASTMLDTLPRK